MFAQAEKNLFLNHCKYPFSVMFIFVDIEQELFTLPVLYFLLLCLFCMFSFTNLFFFAVTAGCDITENYSFYV